MTDELLPYAREVADNAIRIIFSEDSSVDRINLACGMLVTVVNWQQERIKTSLKDVKAQSSVVGKKVEVLDPRP
jgi:hypothetical protein